MIGIYYRQDVHFSIPADIVFTHGPTFGFFDQGVVLAGMSGL